MKKHFLKILKWGLIFSVLALPLLPGQNGDNIYLGAVFNSSHFFISGLVTFFLARNKKSGLMIFLAFALPVAAACAVEILQLFYADRHAGFDDIARSAMGSISALILLKGRKNFLWGAVFSVFFLYASFYDLASLIVRQDLMKSRFPVLDDISAPFYTKAWKARKEAEISIKDDEMIFTAFPNGMWSNIESNILPADWSGYEKMFVRVKSSRETVCHIQLRSDKGRFYGEFRTDTFYQTYSLDLSQFRNGEETLGSDFKINGVSIFLSKPEKLTVLNIERIELR
ncbi:hypothetical protein JXA84_05715 [candidate division WOR-3 bacterium]|nr:hypothetical protein [candidate division WOR-3 bacterium]